MLVLRLLSVGLIAGIVGCGSPPQEKLYPVVGLVTVEGVPVKQGTVVFIPDKEKGNNATSEYRGIINPEGQYSLQSGEQEGAPAGWYVVTIYALDAVDSTKPPEWLVNQKFTQAATSGLSREVVPQPAAGAYDLQVTK